MKIKNLMFLLGFWAIIISLIYFFIPQKSHAMLAEGGGGGGSGLGSRIWVDNYNSGTNWRIKIDYYRDSTGKTTTYYVWSSDGYLDLPFDMQSNDIIHWLSACVDPYTPARIVLDVSCRSFGASNSNNCQSWVNAINPVTCGDVYGACGGPDDYPSAGGYGSASSYASGLGSVGFSTCPIPNQNPGRDSQSDENNFRCAYQGQITANSKYLGCRNTCTYQYCTSGGTWTSTAYSNQCGGASLGSSTDMCGTTSKSCSPPAPSVTATGACNSNADPIINVNYSSNAGSAGNSDYDLRWKSSSSSWGSSGEHDVCTIPAPKSGTDYTITSSALDYGSTYNVQVRQHTDPGINGPTAFGGDSATIPWCPWKVTAHVFVDNNGNGVQDAQDLDYNSNGTNIVNWSQNNTNKPTNSSGDAAWTNNPAGTYTASVIIANLPLSWVISPGNPSSRSVTGPPNQVVNFGIKPPAPTCNPVILSTSALPVNDGIHYPGVYQNPEPSHTPKNTFTISCQGYSNPVPAQIPNFTWSITQLTPPIANPGTLSKTTPSNGTTASVGTYTAPDDVRPNGIDIVVNVQICNPGPTSAAYPVNCNSFSTNPIHIYPLFKIIGSVFNDGNKDGIKQSSESPYTLAPLAAGDITISPSYPINLNYAGNGTFAIYNLPSFNNYTVTYHFADNPAGVGTDPYIKGYVLTKPNPSVYGVTVGPCKVGGFAQNAIPPCDAEQNATNVDFGITNSVPWFQSTGGDFFQRSFTDHIPLAAVGSAPAAPYGGGGNYASIYGVGALGSPNLTPGIIYSGDATATFGPAGSTASVPNWSVGSTLFPETYITNGAPLITSFKNIDSLIDSYNKRGIVQDLSSVCTITNCDLSNANSGIYLVSANSDVTLTASTTKIKPKTNIILLVGYRSVANSATVKDPGYNVQPTNLNINGPVLVPDGSTLFITTAGNINVAKTVGQALPSTYCKVPQVLDTYSTGCDIEGYYSADNSFSVAGDGAAICPSGGADLRLNVAGSVVVNAGDPKNGIGALSYGGRDLCAPGATYPVFTITERPDFILNSPEFFQYQRRVWQEIAP